MDGDEEYYSKIFLIIIFALLVIISFMILKPLLAVIIGACLLAYIFFPLYKWMLKSVRNKAVSALIIVVIILLLVLAPSFYVANALTKEGMTTYLLIKQTISTGKVFNVQCAENDTSLLCGINKKSEAFVSDPENKFYLETTLGKITQYIVNQTTDFIIGLPQIFVGFIIMLFAIFYLLKDHEFFVDKVIYWIPLKKSHKDHIIKEFKSLTFATIYGQFITALIQGAIATVTYLALGINSPIILGLLTAFFAFIPFIGTPIIWVPVSLHMLIGGDVIRGLILFAVGLFIISTIDNILRPIIIGNKTSLHPALIVVGIVGGMLAFGIIGLILGPLVISFLISFIEVYHKEKNSR